MTSIEQAAEEFQLNALAIAGQSLEEKEKQIQALKQRVETLEEMLTRISTQRVPQTQPSLALRPAPRRWSVRE